MLSWLVVALLTAADPIEAFPLDMQRQQQQLQAIRGLAFKRAVDPKQIARSDLRARVVLSLDRELSAPRLHHLSEALALLGFVDAPVPLREILVDLYAADIAGFYDTHTRELVLVRDGAEVEEQRLVVLHELAHALSDQHFNLEALHARVADNDDAQLALTALIEGEATLAMIAGLEGAAATSLAPAVLAKYFELFNHFVPALSSDAYARAPKVVQTSVTFPYLEGTVFVAEAVRAGGWARVDAAYADVPRSTEQILHPYKFFVERDDPASIVCGVDSLRGWRAVHAGNLGQLQIAVLLGVDARARDVAGWDGDRYVLLERDGRHALVWFSVWDSDADALEFATAYAAFLWARQARLDTNTRRVNTDAGLRLHTTDGDITLRAYGRGVWFASGFDVGETVRLGARPLCTAH